MNACVLKLALDAFQGGEPIEAKTQRIEPPRRQKQRQRVREKETEIAGLFSPLNSLSLLANLASWRFNSSMGLIV
jgi:hypothetical protein